MATHDDETRVNARPMPFPDTTQHAHHLRVVKCPVPALVGRTYPLRGLEVRVGRDEKSTVAIADPDLSRAHASLVFGLQGYRLRDLGSTNGTRVNGARIGGDFLLKPGDLILVGSTLLAFERG